MPSALALSLPAGPGRARAEDHPIAGASRHLCLPAQRHAPLVGTGDTTAVGPGESLPRQAAAASALPSRAPVTRLSVSPKEGTGVISPKPFPSAKLRHARGAR